MPNTKSAKKQLRKANARRLHNRSVKNAIRTQIRKVRDAVEAGNLEAAEAEFRLAAKVLDRAGARHTIHRNAASRNKSRLAARIKKLKMGSQGAKV